MKKQIELCKVRPGEIFELDGERFARLPYEDAEAILVVLEDALPDDVCFENDGAKREDHNNLRGAILSGNCSIGFRTTRLCTAQPVQGGLTSPPWTA